MSMSLHALMMTRLILIFLFCIGHVVTEVKIIDLTHTFGHGTVYYPGNPPFEMEEAFRIRLKDNVATSNWFKTAEHSGTHIDAPRHFCPEGMVVHEITLDKLSGPGVVLDFTTQAENDYDYLVSLQDVKDWEAKHGEIPKGAVVLLNYGWNKYWPDMKKVFNTQDLSDYSTIHHPGLGIEASQYLSSVRKVHAVGSDTPSTDNGQTKTFPVHNDLLCVHGLIIIENVGNIDAMPTTGAHVYIGAIKLENGTGTPVRLFATVDDDGDSSGSREITPISGLVILFFSMSMMFVA